MQSAVTAVCFSPDSSKCAVCHANGFVVMFDASEWKCLKSFKYSESAVVAADWTINSSFLSVEDAAKKSAIYRIDVKDGRVFVPHGVSDPPLNRLTWKGGFI